ncbi:MAG: hypothetical protein IJ169_04570 [Paludibacteraceae bacterium]|nr:hypothetical protein [Paludibacteraceae bacterium]
MKVPYNCADPTMVYIYGTRSSSPAIRIVCNGQILILHGGKAYTPAGVEVK